MTHTLLEGFKQFRKETYEGADPLMPRLVEEGQTPEYFIISCIDSRSNPGTVFRPKPGTFFAHKAMGAIVRPYKKGTALSAGLQFALLHNNVQKIIVMGHTGCGAIKALVDRIDDEEISSFIDVAQISLNKAKTKCGEGCEYNELLRLTEEQILIESAENLKTYPSVAQRLAENKVEITPWLFDMKSGNLFEYDLKDGTFQQITEQTEKQSYA